MGRKWPLGCSFGFTIYKKEQFYNHYISLIDKRWEKCKASESPKPQKIGESEASKF